MLLDLNKAIFYRRRRRLLTVVALSRQIFKTRTARAPVVKRFGHGQEEPVLGGTILRRKQLSKKNGKKILK